MKAQSYEGWIQIDLTPGINVTLQPSHMVSRDVFKQTIEQSLVTAYKQLGWDYTQEEIRNHTTYFVILYQRLYSK